MICLSKTVVDHLLIVSTNPATNLQGSFTMNAKKTGIIIAAAAAAMFAAGTVSSVAFADDGVKCMGANACKGQSACKGGTASPGKGQNACKGQGFAEAKDVAACTAAGGKVL